MYSPADVLLLIKKLGLIESAEKLFFLKYHGGNYYSKSQNL